MRDERITWENIVTDMIEQELLSANHFDMVDDSADARDRLWHKQKENSQFNRWNNYLKATKFYRAEKQSTDGDEIRLRFVNEGVWQESKLLSLPTRALREFNYRVANMEKQPDFMNEDRTKMVQQLGNVVVSFEDHSRAVTIPYQQKESVEQIEQEKPKPKSVRKRN